MWLTLVKSHTSSLLNVPRSAFVFFTGYWNIYIYLKQTERKRKLGAMHEHEQITNWPRFRAVSAGVLARVNAITPLQHNSTSRENNFDIMTGRQSHVAKNRRQIHQRANIDFGPRQRQQQKQKTKTTSNRPQAIPKRTLMSAPSKRTTAGSKLQARRQEDKDCVLAYWRALMMSQNSHLYIFISNMPISILITSLFENNFTR